MKNKILLIIAILCMLVPFVFAGLSVSAEQYLEENEFSLTVFNYAFTDFVQGIGGSNGVYVWSGSPQFTLNHSTFPSSVYQVPYTVPSYFPSAYSLPLTMVYGNVGFEHDVNAGYLFKTSTDSVDFYVADNRLHTFVVVLSYHGRDQSETEFLASNILSQYTWNGYLLSSYPNFVKIDLATCYWEVLDSNANTGRWVVTSDTFYDYNYGFLMQFPAMESSSYYPDQDPFVLNNQFYMISFTLGNGSYTFGGTSNSNGTIIGMYDIYTTSPDYTAGFDTGFDVGYTQGYQQGNTNGYQEGFDVGYSQGVTAGTEQANSTVNTSSASYQAGLTAGIQQSNSTVNINSASYQAGLNQGREDAGNLTFMSLIGAVLDAPIRAFFGFIDSNGVQHPGLFTLEILGFDMSAVILSIFTLCVIIVIIRMCLGGGK